MSSIPQIALSEGPPKKAHMKGFYSKKKKKIQKIFYKGPSNKPYMQAFISRKHFMKPFYGNSDLKELFMKVF